MAVVNDFPGLYEKIRAYADTMARSMNVDPKAIYAFFNKKGGHFPQSVQELNAFGNEVDPTYGYSRRDPTTGAWQFIGGGQKTPGLTDVQRGGFAGHFQNNADDFDIERFQQVDPSGTVFGGSWDQNYNAAHPELAGKSGFDTPLGQSAGLANLPVQSTGRGPTMQTQGRAFDAGNFVAPAGGGFTSVVNGSPSQFATQQEAEADFNARTGGGGAAAPGPTQPGPSASPAASAAPAPYQGDPASAPGSTSPTATFTNPQQNSIWEQLANNAAQQEYNRKRLELDRDIANKLDEREKQRIAQEAARDAWTKAYQGASLTGYTPTAAGQSDGERALAAWNQSDKTPQAAVAIWKALKPGLTDQEALALHQQFSQYATATGQAPPQDVINATLTQVTGGRISGETPTLDREKEQNSTLISTLRLLADLRGPEGAFAYADTLANIPASIRGQIQAAMGRLPVQSQNPAQAGVLGDLGVQPPAAAVPPSHAASAAPAPGTVQTGNAMQAAPGVGGLQPTQVGGSAMQAAPGMRQALGQPQQHVLGAGAQPTLQQTGPDQISAQLAAMPVQTGQPIRPATAAGMALPGQLSPTDMARTPAYLRELMWRGYEHSGEDYKNVQDEYMRSLPVASGPRRGTYRAA